MKKVIITLFSIFFFTNNALAVCSSAPVLNEICWEDGIRTAWNGYRWANASTGWKASTKVADFSVTPQSCFFIYSVSGTTIATLDTTASLGNGCNVAFRNIGVNGVTITPNVLDTIDGVAGSIDVPIGTTIELVSNGISNWVLNTQSSISKLNTSAYVTDSGVDGQFTVVTDGTTRSTQTSTLLTHNTDVQMGNQSLYFKLTADPSDFHIKEGLSGSYGLEFYQGTKNILRMRENTPFSYLAVPSGQNLFIEAPTGNGSVGVFGGSGASGNTTLSGGGYIRAYGNNNGTPANVGLLELYSGNNTIGSIKISSKDKTSFFDLDNVQELLGISLSEVVVNDGGLAVDFRVESDDQPEAFKINGTDGYITTNQSLNNALGDETAMSIAYTTNKAAGSDTGLKINQTDTASPGTSLLLDLQSGGVSKYSVDNTGTVLATSLSAPNFYATSTLLPNTILNGTFDVDLSNWSGAGWAQSAGTTVHSTGTTALSQGVATATIGKTYKLTFDLVFAGTGSLTPSFGGVTGFAYTASATGITQYITAIATTALAFTPTSGFLGSIDNVTLQEVSAGDLTIGGKIVAQDISKPVTFSNTLSNPVANEIAYRFDYTTNKATSGNDTGLVINQTDTASPGTSNLIDAQVGGVTKFKVTNLGQISAGAFGSLASSTASLFGGSSGGNVTPAGSIQIPPATSVFSASSAQQVIVGINPTYNQSSTAGGTDLLINRTQTAVGSGAQNLIDAQVGGVSKYKLAVGNDATTGAFNGSSGVETAMSILPIYNQTGTAGGTDLLINRTQTAVGSGAQNLIDAQVGGVSKFSVGNLGQTKVYSLNALSSTSTLDIQGYSNAGNNYKGTRFAYGTFTGTGGSNTMVSIEPVYNYSGGTSVSNTDFLINRTETNLGTTPGAQNLIDAQVGGTSKFKVSNLGNITLDGQTAKTISIARNTTTNTAGTNTTISGSGATSGATDKDGGRMTIAPGVSTGTGMSSVRIQALTRASSTGTSDNVLVDRIITPSRKHLTDNTAIPLFEVSLANGETTGGQVEYTIHVSDGTDYQAHTGIMIWGAVNKAGTITSNFGHAAGVSGLELDVVSAGTIADTFTITNGTGKITINLNANSSLTPTTLYVDYVIKNNSGSTITQL